jgi:hypothetical protein
MDTVFAVVDSTGYQNISNVMDMQTGVILLVGGIIAGAIMWGFIWSGMRQ